MNNKESHGLTQEQLKFFTTEGYIGPFDAYTPDEVDLLWRKARLETFDYSHSVYGRTSNEVDPISSYDRHLDVPFLADHVCNPHIVKKLASIFGNGVLCWRSEFFPKYPGDEGTDWHQGDTFAGLNGGKDALRWKDTARDGGTITVWTALSDVTMDMGPFGVIPRTQNSQFYDEKKIASYSPDKVNITKNGVKRGFYGYDYRELQIDPNWAADESKAVYFTMKKGQFVIFWSTLLHGSLPHLGHVNTPRLGYATRYVPTSVQIYPESDSLTEFGRTVSLEKYGSVLVSGTDEYKHNRIATETTRGYKFKKV